MLCRSWQKKLQGRRASADAANSAPGGPLADVWLQRRRGDASQNSFAGTDQTVVDKRAECSTRTFAREVKGNSQKSPVQHEGQARASD